MIKLIASDMDGTLLNEHGKLNDGFYHILDQLCEKNIIFVASSGRQYHNLVNTFSHAKDKIFYIAENGTFVVDNNGNELYSNFINRTTIMDLIDLGRNLTNCALLLCGKKSCYIETTAPEIIKEVEKYYARYKIVKDLKMVDDDIIKFTICDLSGATDNSNKVIYPLYKDKLQVTVSGLIWLDIVNRGVNKGAAIKKLQEKFNISEKETMVFGDYFNDIEMLQSAYYSYAMENAQEEVKKHARFIAGKNSENGVLNKIKEIVL